MMIPSPATLKSILTVFIVLCACIARAEDRKWTTFVTPINCTTFQAQIVSICYQTREQDEPAICKSQRLEFLHPVKKSMLLFTPPYKNSEYYEGLGRHVLQWFCSLHEGQNEILTLDISNWFNAQDEDIYMFNSTGNRLTEKAVHRIASTPAWRNVNGSPERGATAYGDVNYPEYK